jgi:sugar lactone lactonase YvrE
VAPTGDVEIIARTEDLPGGLGWLPDGRLLVVFMTRRRLMQMSGGRLVDYADLSAQASFHCNDMVVDALGRTYVGNFGFDLHGGGEVAPAEIIRIDGDGAIEVFAQDVIFPNGSVITPSADTLLVAETFAHRISAFGLDVRGCMAWRRVWADLGEQTPDGICMDAEDTLWVASPSTGTVSRVKQGGAVLDRCATRGTPYACMLGGADRRTLYACTAETDDPAQAAKRRSGRIEQVRVPVPGAGLP